MRYWWKPILTGVWCQVNYPFFLELEAKGSKVSAARVQPENDDALRE